MASKTSKRGIAHRLLHSVVISSVLALESVGCGISHDRVDPPDDDGGPRDRSPDAGRRRDAGFRMVDAGTPVEPDAGRADAGAPPGDAGPPPPDAGDARACEPGWPTTKGFFCTTVSDDLLLCCNSFGEDPCCLREAP